jgi:hypothetical protein
MNQVNRPCNGRVYLDPDPVAKMVSYDGERPWLYCFIC